MSFDDLLSANRSCTEGFSRKRTDDIAHAGVAIVICMDSRIDSLPTVGLGSGDAKTLRSPGGWVASWTMTGLVLAAQLLHVERIMLIPHARCVASGTDEALYQPIAERNRMDTTRLSSGASPDQMSRLKQDVSAVLAHPLIKNRAKVGGFTYDADTGLLE